MMTAPRTRWLRRELLLRLMLPLLAIVLVTGMAGAYAAQRFSDRVFDRWLLDAARSLAHQVRFKGPNAEVDLPAVAEAMLIYDETDTVYFSLEQQGEHRFGQRGIPNSGAREATYRAGRTFDASYAGHPVRVAAVEIDDGSGARATVLLAETTLKRERAAREVLMLLLPLGLLVLATALTIGIGVQRTLRPLETIATRWNALSNASLEPIAAEDMPRELAPFASALNGLLGRIRAMLRREREFVATAAHQLRTPLAGMRLGLARAAEAPDLPATRQVLRELDRSTERTARLLQQLLSLGRLDPEARGDSDFVRLDLVALSQEVGSAYLELAEDKQIELELREPPQPLWLTGQPELLAEALGNLLDNALRYTPRGGRVLIEFDASPPAVQVSDSGPGVPEDERETVFQRLVRGREATGDGSGLGLAIVRDIAALHDATVSLDSSALGGARVTMRFERAAS